jgi:endonuclease/exonuclease/phosphatase (EEP) superfamily protein YafD
VLQGCDTQFADTFSGLEQKAAAVLVLTEADICKDPPQAMIRLIRKLFDHGMIVSATGAVVLTGMLLLGVASPLFDLLNSGAPLVTLGAVGLLALSLLVSPGLRKRVMVLSVVALAGTGVLVGPELWAAFSQKHVAPVPGHTLRILDHNVWEANVDVDETVRVIRQANADIVFLQEREGRGAVVAEALRAEYPYNSGLQRSGELILSRPPMAPRRVLAPVLRQIVRVGNVTWAVVAPPDQVPFVVATTHFVHPDPGSPQQSQRFAAEVFLRQFGQSSTIFTGDFNLTPWSFRMHRQDRDLKLVRRTLALPTWPARLPGAHPFPFPFLPIDHVYASSDWKLVSVERGPRTGSDHYPVIVTLTR